jgi:hypothetical protein
VLVFFSDVRLAADAKPSTMTEFYGPPLDPRQIPNDLTTAEFMLDYRHPLRPAQGTAPCLIEDATGRAVYLHEVCSHNVCISGVVF